MSFVSAARSRYRSSSASALALAALLRRRSAAVRHWVLAADRLRRGAAGAASWCAVVGMSCPPASRRSSRQRRPGALRRGGRRWTRAQPSRSSRCRYRRRPGRGSDVMAAARAGVADRRRAQRPRARRRARAPRAGSPRARRRSRPVRGPRLADEIGRELRPAPPRPVAAERPSVAARDVGLLRPSVIVPRAARRLDRRSHSRRAAPRARAHPPRRLARPDRRRAAARRLLVQPADLDRLHAPARRERARLRRRSPDERYRRTGIRRRICWSWPGAESGIRAARSRSGDRQILESRKENPRHVGRQPRTRHPRVAPSDSSPVRALLTLTVALAAAQTGPSRFPDRCSIATGAPVPGATVTLMNTRTQARFEVKTDDSGRFEFVPLPADTYTLEGELPGFKKRRGADRAVGQEQAATSRSRSESCRRRSR